MRAIIDLFQWIVDPKGYGQMRRRCWYQAVPIDLEKNEQQVVRMGQGHEYRNTKYNSV